MNDEGQGTTAGTVYLVGAGPGDPGLITVRGMELIRSADVVFHDRLIPTAALAAARPDAELVYVGKTPRIEADRDGSVSQEEIIEKVIAAARDGKMVVRLKGGDPFVFGRGGEEAEALREAGIDYQVIPGVTAAVAAPAYAGIPVTHREDAAGVAFVTGHEPGLDWEALARFPGTLAFYMGVRSLAENAAALIAGGRAPDEPVAVVERGTLPGQRVIHATLATIGEVAAREGIEAPSIVIVGKVAARGRRLSWFETGPLGGKTVVVTRARAQASRLRERLRALGASVVELPMIRVEPTIEREEVRKAVAAIHTYAVVVLTSANGIELLFKAMAAQGLDARALANATVAAVGPSTAEVLARHGIRADVVPRRAVAEALVEALEPVEVRGRPVLIAGAAAGRPIVAEALAARGAEVDRVSLYETVAETVEPTVLEQARRAEYVTLASASAARHLASALGDGGPESQGGQAAPSELRGEVISMGPITSAAARELGFEVGREADPHTLDGLIACLLTAAADSHSE